MLYRCVQLTREQHSPLGDAFYLSFPWLSKADLVFDCGHAQHAASFAQSAPGPTTPPRYPSPLSRELH
jgi:hypothetical protein